MNIIAIVHVIAFLVAIGYAQNYYFHLRKSSNFDQTFGILGYKLIGTYRPPQEQRSLDDHGLLGWMDIVSLRGPM